MSISAEGGAEPNCGEGAEDTRMVSTSPCSSQCMSSLLPTERAAPGPSQATSGALEPVRGWPLLPT